MPILRYHAADFGGGNSLLVGTHDLDVSWEQINWAAQTVGKAEHHVGMHGLFSLFEAAYRTTIVWANLMESASGRLIKSPAYEALDPSEKGSISYYLGLIFAKLFAFRRLDTPWLLHFDVYREEHEAVLEGNEKPDLIGLNAAGNWIVYEAKGRTGGFLTSVLDDAKGQAQEITTIGGIEPVLRVGSLVYFRSDGLHLSVVDPPSDKSRRRRDVKLSERDFLAQYYATFDAAVDVRQNARREERNGEEYRILELNDLDVAIGVPVAARLERRVTPPRQIDDASFIGPDGIEIALGGAWSQVNMRRDPRVRTR
ncbi:hypothetical protein HNQ77_004958 [Silvibacterium bohemicum]|uniref:Uncharacterized protein n=1 Tax=Silvibacterium bohemicum TaxID=1577686 RepID=A0A841JZQ9_9BACT|nr:hypothetical protein [Silvibacterium bohemicum]MBB6146973.1 hypothetical protein [Silvibacterium bohemicum]